MYPDALGRSCLIVVFMSLPVLWVCQSARAAEGTGEFLDAAPFARVCTWDPQREVGVRATRLQEIAAEDLYLETDLIGDNEQWGLSYRVLPAANGEACIGLQWIEARPLTRLHIEFNEAPAGPGRVQFWQGETIWQGKWTSVDGKLDAGAKTWTFTVAKPGGLYWKVRWIIPTGAKPVVVNHLSAITSSPMSASTIVIQSDPARPGQTGELLCYNARMGFKQMRPWLFRSWDLGSPLELTIQHADIEATRKIRADRAMIRFRMPDGAFAVAIDDVLERGPVYLPHVGLFVSKAPPAKNPEGDKQDSRTNLDVMDFDRAVKSLEEYKREIASKKTVLQRVREMPDQTRERAMKITHYDPRLDAGRMMISLACDNAKFVTEANGTMFYFERFDRDEKGAKANYVLTPSFGARRVLGQSQGWGILGMNKAAHVDPTSVLPLRIKEKNYQKGLGHHAPGEISIDVGEGHDRFEAEVGLQWQGGGTPGSVVFQVLVDSEKKFDSGVMREKDDPQTVSVALAGARILTLKLTDAGDGLGFDTANWCDARLTRTDAAATPVYLTELFTETPQLKRHLEGGWLPAPVISTSVDGVEYRQRTYVVPLAKENLPTAPLWLNEKPLCVVELSMNNNTAESADVGASYLLSMGGDSSRPPICQTAGTRTTIVVDDKLVGVFDHSEFVGGKVRAERGRFSISGRLPGGGSGRCYLYLPAWRATPDQQGELAGGQRLFDRFKAYWEAIMAKGAQIDLPDRWVADVIRANQVHILLAARNEQQGRQVVPWIASDRYWVAIDSEGNSVIRGMQYWGHFDFAQRSFEYFFTHYKPEGFMTMGYTLMGNGWHLWALGEYMRLARDEEWFKSVAETPAGLCQWVMDQLAKTRRFRAAGRKVPEYGLMPPGVQADWNAYAYYFYANSYFHAGLRETGQALKLIGHPDADKVLAAGQQLGEDVGRAFAETQALAPVVLLQDGTWVPYYPASVYTPGPMADYYPGQDGNRSWAYDVDLGPHHMVPLGTMTPDAPEVDWIMDHMEDVHFLDSGWGGYPADRNHADWFDMGGFAKVQPYYARNAEICALRDDIKPFVRSYFNTLASLIDGTCLSIFEHFSNFCYNKTHETGYFLHQSRTMLLTERGDELWLAPFVTDNWLKDGMTIGVKNAPTFFGPVSYRIVSSVSAGRIEAAIEPPTRSAPKAIVLRLRHPEGKPIKSVQVNGKAHRDFDNAGQTIRLLPVGTRLALEVRY